MDADTNESAPGSKPIRDSAIDNYPYLLFSNDLNCHRTVFGGRLLEIADRLAGTVAFQHSGETCVTVGLDEVRFIAPAREGDLIVFKASVNRAWNSSMEVGVKVLGKNPITNQTWHVISMYFTFVAVGADGKKRKIPGAMPETDEEKRRCEAADERRKRRLALKK